MAISVLVAEDDRNIADLLKMYLEKEGYAVTWASDGGQALEKFRTIKPDLVLLDVMMPVMDGWSVCRAIRAESKTPVIMLTAKGETDDKVTGLKSGADDYVTKPFDPVEVQARVRSQLRRYTMLGARPGGDEGESYTVGGVCLNDQTKSVTVDGEPVALTPLEFNILRLLIKNPGRIYSSAQIYELVWNEDSLGTETSVAVHIRHLRQKIEINPSEPRYLKVVWGLGYKMEDRRNG